MIGLTHVGGPIAGVALALLLLARTNRERLAALGFVFFGAAVVGAALAPHHHLLVFFGGVLVAIALAIGLAAIFRSYPWAFAVLALVCVPIRISIHIGGSGHKLLAPLYLVIAAGAVLFAWDLLAGDDRARELGSMARPLALLIAWSAISLTWTRDVHEGAVDLLAFWIPFALLAIAVARLPWDELGLRALAATATTMGVAFAGVGIYQYETRTIFQNPKVITANAYAPLFRVNSVFWDPSIYGRFLVVALVPGIVLLARRQLGRLTPLVVATIFVTWIGLFFSFSQSSFAALLVVSAGALFLLWRWRAVIVIVAAAAVLGGIAVAQPQVRRSLQHHSIGQLNNLSSGRASLVTVGVQIARAHPVRGVGLGGFKQAYAKRTHLKGKEPKRAASHNTAVTVAAETGAPGFLLYVWLVVVALRQAFRRRRTVGIVAGLGIAAIFVHSLFYNAFFEDPTTWGLFGLAVLGAPVVRARIPKPVPPPREQPTREREMVPA